MEKLDWSTVGQLLASVVLLLISIVLLFSCLLRLVVQDLIVDLFDVLLDLKDHLRLYHVFTTFILDDFFKFAFLLFLLADEVLPSDVDFARLLDLDSKQALFEHVASVLNLM